MHSRLCYDVLIVLILQYQLVGIRLVLEIQQELLVVYYQSISGHGTIVGEAAHSCSCLCARAGVQIDSFTLNPGRHKLLHTRSMHTINSNTLRVVLLLEQYAEYAYYESYSNQYAYSTSSYSSRNNGQSWIRTIHFNSVVCVYMTDFVRSRRQHLSQFVRSQRQIFWPLCASPLVFFRVRHQYQMLLYAYGYDVT